MAKKDLLDIKLENSLAFQIDYTSNFNKSFRRAFHKKFMNSNISMDELAILLLINIRPDITQTALARYMFKGKAHVGKILNIMEEKGLIKRKYIEHSNTTKNIITKKGNDILKQGQKDIENIEKKTKDMFSLQELEQFFEYLKKYRKLLESIVEVKIK